MTLARDGINAPAMVAASDRLSGTRSRRTRLRSCLDCGKFDEVRADNPSPRCKRCATRSMLELGRALKSAGRNRETCQHCRTKFAAPPSSRQKFCSRACRAAAKSIERTCATCGSVFRIARSLLSGKCNSSGRFCFYERHLSRIRGRGSRWKTIRKSALRLTPFCACCAGISGAPHHPGLTRDNSPTNLIPLWRLPPGGGGSTMSRSAAARHQSNARHGDPALAQERPCHPTRCSLNTGLSPPSTTSATRATTLSTGWRRPSWSLGIPIVARSDGLR
jgi:hypothetical protein